MAGPTTISPEEFEKFRQQYAPQSPTETPIERIGQSVASGFDFLFGRDPSMVGGKPVQAPVGDGTALKQPSTPMQTPVAPSAPIPRQAPAITPDASPALQESAAPMDTLGAMNTGIFGAPITPSASPQPMATQAPQAPQVAANVPSAPMQPIAPETMQPQAPVTGPTFQGQPLSEYLAGGIQLDPQGRMIDPDVDRSAFEQASEARSMAAGNSIRPGVDVPSLAMQRARMDAGLDPVAGAPMGTEMSQQQQRDMLDRGFDPATGKKIGGDMTAQERANLAKTEAQIKTEQIRQAGMIQDIEQKGIKASEAKSEAEAQSISELTSYGEQINKLTGVRDEIAKLTGNRKTTEGGLGWLNAKLPLGSNARSVARLVKEIEGSTFIRGIIDAKNRGATFGPLSDQEGANIVAAYGKILEPDMKNDDRIRAINELLGAMNAGFSGATDRHKAKYGGSGQKSESKPTGGTIPNVEGVTIKIKG